MIETLTSVFAIICLAVILFGVFALYAYTKKLGQEVGDRDSLIEYYKELLDEGTEKRIKKLEEALRVKIKERDEAYSLIQKQDKELLDLKWGDKK